MPDLYGKAKLPHWIVNIFWERAKDFVERAFTVILVATVIIWFLQTFSWHLQMVEPSQSILAGLSGIIAPVFKLQGLNDWRIVTALVAGFLAKESVVSSLNVLFGSASGIAAVFGAPSAMALLVFCLLYTPCMAAIASIKRELGGRWAILLVIFQCVIAWLISALAFVIAGGIA